MGWLSKLASRPEVLGALIGGGAGALTAEEEESLLRRIGGGAALGAGTGAAMKKGGGLLSRLGKRASDTAPTESLEEVIRRARSTVPGVDSQSKNWFPSTENVEAMNDLGEAWARKNRPELFGRTGLDEFSEVGNDVLEKTGNLARRAPQTVRGAIGEAETTANTGIDAAASVVNRAADRTGDVAERVGHNLKRVDDAFNQWPSGIMAGAGVLGAAGAAGAGLYGLHKMQLDEQAQQKLKGDVDAALSGLGFPANELGLRAFQEHNGIEPTGELDPGTRTALGRAIVAKAQQGGGAPQSPSLAPERR